jgi:putative NADPH-quinone reductase
MKVLVVVAHQQLGSFNHAIAAASIEQLRAEGHQVIYHDLYEERFDAILPKEEVPKTAPIPPEIAQHCREVQEVDGYVIVHPNWWAMPPAILKGWVDRVFRQGVTYGFGPNGVIQYLKGKRAVVVTTSNTPRDMELQLYGDPLENLWKNCIFGLCGVTDFCRRNFEPVILSTPEQRQGWLQEVRQIVAERFAR